MMYLKFIPILLGAAAAQSTMYALEDVYIYNETFTLEAFDASRTTYVHHCTPVPMASISAYSRSPLKTTRSRTSTFTATSSNPFEFVKPTFPAERVRRQSNIQLANPDLNFCLDLTIIKGLNTEEHHHTIPEPEFMTMDAGCHWEGELTAADVTCTYTVDGSVWAKSVRGAAQTATLSRGDFGDRSSYRITTLTVVTPTTSGNKAASTAPAGTSPANYKSPGLAPAGALPTGVLGLVGGAVAVLAAAVAL